jgi:hypothetical protein
MTKTTKRQRTLAPSKFKVGDRVALNIRNITCFSQTADQKIKDQITGYAHSSRLGVVKEVFIKTNKRGDRRHYAAVLWDGLKSTTEHEQGRLMVHAESVVKQEEEKEVKVPKLSSAAQTSKKKTAPAVEILNLCAVQDKQVFTARTESGYVGCVRMSSGVCFTIDVFDSALEAANKARSLKRQLETKATELCKENEKNTEEIKKPVVKKTNKKVTLRSRLYTLDETKAMPLLRFQEVWVIIKDSMYVSDCLDKERRNLVSYTSNKDKALYFTCHEKAKMTMRVLKGAVGPGFDLKRFFIENKEK